MAYPYPFESIFKSGAVKKVQSNPDSYGISWYANYKNTNERYQDPDRYHVSDYFFFLLRCYCDFMPGMLAKSKA